MGKVVVLAHSVEMETIECGECGIVFAMPAHRLDESKKRSDKNFYCPNGHPRIFAESEADRLRKMLEQANRKNSDLLDRSSKIERENVRLKKRINAGICPHCNRTFKQLARHMETKHADLVKK